MKVDYNKYLKPQNFLKLGIVLVLIVTVFSLYENTYDQQILKIRKEKDHHFRTSIDSPLKDKNSFAGLSYFPVENKYYIKAELSVMAEEVSGNITRSDGSTIEYLKFGTVSFKVDTSRYELIVFKNKANNKNDNMLFLPFSDKSNGDQTYTGGRYLDIAYSGNDKIVLDFNLAYNPYCVYNYKYACPIPPQENYINTAILAGEMLPLSNIPLNR